MLSMAAYINDVKPPFFRKLFLLSLTAVLVLLAAVVGELRSTRADSIANWGNTVSWSSNGWTYPGNQVIQSANQPFSLSLNGLTYQPAGVSDVGANLNYNIEGAASFWYQNTQLFYLFGGRITANGGGIPPCKSTPSFDSNYYV